MSFFSDLLKKCKGKSSKSAAAKRASSVLGLSDENLALLKQIDPKIIIGRVLTIRPHPDPKMTKVRITTCDLGDEGEPVQILCGGTNIEVGLVVPIATVGAKLSEDFEISVREIRGEESHGMICAQSELGLKVEEEKGVIWPLPIELENQLGTSLNSL